MCILITVGLFLASFVLSQLLAPKPKIENARPAGLGDFSVPTATEARTIPLVFGTVRMDGPNVIWYGDLEQAPIRQSVKKNLFSKVNVTVGYKYYLGLQFGLCRGDGSTGLLRIWVGDDLLWGGPAVGFGSVGVINIDEPDFFGGDELGAGGIVGTLRFHPGTTSQAVSAYLSQFQQSAVGTNKTPRYTGTSYLTLEHGYVGNSTTLKNWSFELQRITNGLSLDLAEKIINGYDANPMNVTYELITNTEWGFGHPAAKIDLTNFEDAANTLAAEGCGFSMLVDSALESSAFKEEIERQINGKIFLSPQDGKWRVKLARDDYSINSVPELKKDTNILAVEDFTRGSWVDTQNQVRLFYFDRDLDYKERPAPAFDMANAMIQGGGTVLTMRNEPSEVRFPGIKNSTFANQTAWRVLRSISYPLAKAKVTVDRSLWDVLPFDVVAWTDADLGFTKMPMRVNGIDYGSLDDGQIVLDLVQDIWKFAAGSFGDPPGTGWTPPVDTLAPFDNVFVFESPRAMLARAAGFAGTYTDRVATAAARKGAEVGYEIFQRVGAAAYVSGGHEDQVIRLGTLTSSLPRGDVSSVTFNVTCATAADKSAILAAFNYAVSATDLGTNLLNVLRIGNEFMIATDVASGTGNTVDFSGVYRQMMDSVQVAHASSAVVWMLFMGIGMAQQTYANGDSVDVKLLPTSRSDEVAIGSVTAANVSMANRLRRPYPPGLLALNGTNNDTTSVSLEGTGSGDATGILLEIIRRDFRTVNEVLALTVDAATLFSDFPSANTWTFTVAVYNDPAGANLLLFTTVAQSAASITIPRTTIFRYTNSVIPTTLGITITASHVVDGNTYAARYGLAWTFTVTSALTGLFSFGSINNGVSSATFTADATGTWTLSIATAMSTGNVQVNVAGGGFVNVITTGNTSGTFSASSSDSIVVKHSESTSGFMTALLLRNPSSTAKAFGVAYA